MIMIMTIVSVEQRPGWGEHGFHQFQQLFKMHVINISVQQLVQHKLNIEKGPDGKRHTVQFHQLY